MSRLIAVGDIHGELEKLESLMFRLDEYGVDFDNDRFIFLGDYVDGGPDARGVIEYLHQFARLYPQTVFLKGNHEDLLINAYNDGGKYTNGFLTWYTQGGMETLQSYGEATYEGSAINVLRKVIPVNHIVWMDNLPAMFATKSFYFVHAGLDPDVEEWYENNEYTCLWIRNQFINSKRDWGKVVVFGHTARNEPIVKPNKLGLDTMHHGEGVITAAVLDDEEGSVVDFVTSEPREWSWKLPGELQRLTRSDSCGILQV